MGKSSYSVKKKRSKYSSLSHLNKRHKTKRSKLNKHRRHDDSVSYSDDDSSSSVSVSSYDLEDSYKGRRSRSRTRKDVKGSKKKRCTHSSSSEGSLPMRKHKMSRRNDNYEARKNTHEKKRKKAIRDASLSSRSSGLRTCSTCQSRSSDESEYEKHRDSSARREKHKRKSESIRSGNKRKRYRSRSCSSCSRQNASIEYYSEPRVTSDNYSKRLKSVITLTKKERELNMDEDKEEVVYDHDDYPSSRSNDSNDAGNKRELAYQSNVTSERTRPTESEKREGNAVYEMRTTKLTEVDKEGEGQYQAMPDCDIIGTSDATKEKNNEISVPVVSVNDDNLESILRQKALENLKRFRGGLQINAKAPVNHEDECYRTFKPPSAANIDQVKLPNDDGAVVDWQDSRHSLQNDDVEKESGSAKNGDRLPKTMTNTGREKVNIPVGSVISKQRLITSALKQALSNSTSAQTEIPTSQRSDQAKLVIENTVTKSAAQTAHYMISPSGNGNSYEVNNASNTDSAELPSFDATAAGDIGNSSKSQDGGDDGSQLQQKTMSVMRGGEMVQVSYKVYIPKKAPALARRPLKR